jgi:hypothetical protein
MPAQVLEGTHTLEHGDRAREIKVGFSEVVTFALAFEQFWGVCRALLGRCMDL